MKSSLNVVAAVGLVLGGALGLAGTLVAAANVRAILWGIDGTGVIVGTTILALRNFRAGRDAQAAGFLVFAIGEGVMFSGTASPLEAMVPSFCAGIALWSAGLLLTSIPRGIVPWARLAGVIAAILFATTSARILAGDQIVPTAKPLPTIGYPFLVITFAGWIWTVLRDR